MAFLIIDLQALSLNRKVLFLDLIGDLIFEFFQLLTLTNSFFFKILNAFISQFLVSSFKNIIVFAVSMFGIQEYLGFEFLFVI